MLSRRTSVAAVLALLGCGNPHSEDADGSTSQGDDTAADTPCPTPYDVISASEVREGLSGEALLAEYEGTRSATLDWVGESPGASIEFAQKGTSTPLELSIEDKGGEVRWYHAGQVTGSLGCGARLAVEVTVSLQTGDGTLQLTRPALLERPVLSDADLDALQIYEASFWLDLVWDELDGAIEIAGITPDADHPWRTRIRAGFWRDGTWNGEISAEITERIDNDSIAVHPVTLGRW